MRSMLIPLEDIREPATAGTKALGLARMSRAGLPVPSGFCVPGSVYRRHLEANDLVRFIESQLTGITGPATRGEGGAGEADPERGQILAGIRDAVTGSPLDPEFEVDVKSLYEGLGSNLVAVRSSASAEDLPGFSFAGQHGTYFAGDAGECLKLLRYCWASLWTERAFEYREQSGFGHLDADMAVIVQELVRAHASGVIFTADPVTGADRVVIEACFGLGEALVSGKVTPDRFVLSKDDLSVLEHEIAEKRIEIVAGEGGRVAEREVPAERMAMPVIAGETASRLAGLALQAEMEFDEPLDIEWAESGGELWLLQARSITTLDRTAPAESGVDSVARSADRVVVWSNANSGEVLPDVVTPMTWSIIRDFVDDMMRSLFGNMGVDLGEGEVISLVAGRAYFNVTLLASGFGSVPAIKTLDFDELLGGMQQHFDFSRYFGEENLPEVKVSRLGMILGLPRIILWAVKHSPGRAQKFVVKARRDTEEMLLFESTDSTEEEYDVRRRRLLEDLVSLVDALGYAGVAMAHYGNLNGLCRRWLGDETGETTNRLLGGRGGVFSAEAGIALWELAEFIRERPGVRELIERGEEWERTRALLGERAAGGEVEARNFLTLWDAWMYEHGHHARGEIELGSPRWAERPGYVLDLVRSYLESPEGVNPASSLRAKGAESDELAAECRRRLKNPFKRIVFNVVLRDARRGSAARENVKNEGVRRLAAIRSLLLRVGEKMVERGILEESSDIFFLRLVELEPVRRGESGMDVKQVVSDRRAEYVRNCAMIPPPVVIGEWDEEESLGPVDREIEVLRGLGVSPGVATGPARVISSLQTEDRVIPGEILVAPFTDPGWTPYFVPAAGIVMDMGGMLSHGSIIAREYGIPAVVNVGPATKILETGQTIEVNGNRGEVRILSKNSAPGRSRRRSSTGGS